MISPAINGFLTSLALILAIGAQNAFVLKQGIQRQHVFWVVLTCALSDAILISAGVAGFGVMILAFPALPRFMTIAGAAFLFFYGISKLYAAYRGGDWQKIEGKDAALVPTVFIALALTWLNPHVYLDTLGLIGAISTQYGDVTEKTAFAFGAITASFLFFFSLGYGARYLAPVMKTPRTWQVLDVLIGLLMFYLAFGLLRGM